MHGELRFHRMKRVMSCLFIVLTTLSACSKVSREDRKSIEGSYDWFYSFDGYTESNSSLEIADQYGIKITKNGKVSLFENGIELNKGKMIGFTSFSDTYFQVSVKWDKWDTTTFELMNDEIIYTGWPFNAHKNYFKKFED